MKKSLLIFTLILGSSLVSFGQKTEKKTTIDAYSQELDEMEKVNPGKLALIEKYKEHGLLIMEAQGEPKNTVTVNQIPLRDKGKSLTIKEFLKLSKSKKFNPYVLAWFPGVERQSFRLEGTQYIVIIPSQKDLNRTK